MLSRTPEQERDTLIEMAGLWTQVERFAGLNQVSLDCFTGLLIGTGLPCGRWTFD